MVLVQTQVTKGSLPGLYRPAAIRAVLLLFIASFLPTPWLAISLPRTSTHQLSASLLEFAIGIPLGLIALAFAWRLFVRAVPSAVIGRGGFASLHAAFLILLVPMVTMGMLWLPLVRWSLVGGYFFAAGAGFFGLLLLWVGRLPDIPSER